jgi:hypothetical protein
MPVTEQAREIGICLGTYAAAPAGERWKFSLPRARNRFSTLARTLRGSLPRKLTCCTRVWLELSDKLPGQEIHHHDIVHFALGEVEREMAQGETDAVLERLRQHVHEIRDSRLDTGDAPKKLPGS